VAFTAGDPGPDEIRGQVRDLAGRLGIAGPDVVIATVSSPACAVLTASGRRQASLVPGGAPPVLTVDSSCLAMLPGSARRAALAHPLAQLALDQPRRRKRRTNLAAALSAVAVLAVASALSWPLPAWTAAIALAVAVATVVDVATIRAFLYEADHRVAGIVGAEGLTALLDHLQAHQPALGGWPGFASRMLPPPGRRAIRLSRRPRRGCPAR
jgi:hypothetical protein